VARSPDDSVRSGLARSDLLQKHELGSNSSVRLDLLSRQSFVDLTPERALRKLVDQVFTQHHLPRSIVYQVSDIETLLYLVARGLGVAIVPSALARSSAQSPNLCALRIVSATPKLPKWKLAILTRNRRRDLLGKTTVELFLETLDGLPGMPKFAGES
jgi:DNA-binding transcriptional LysR family regulator